MDTSSSFPEKIAKDADARPSKSGKDFSAKGYTFWTPVRLAGGVFFSVAVLFIIHGLLQKAAQVTEKATNKSLQAIQLTEKPTDEVRTFEFVTLPNGVQVVTIQDKRALQHAFAAAVEAGSFDNPVELPGLAHFAEHMVFLGSKKYPQNQGFDDFMAAHGGYNNAFTSDELTVYYAALSQDAAPEGFDRFADFIKAPLFSPEYAAKEVNAVDSEHHKNIQNRYQQVLAVLHSLAVEESPVGRFSTGNKETLRTDAKGGTVKALRTFWETHYCPDRVKVVTVASDSNAEQLKRVQKEFGNMTAPSQACNAPRKKFGTPIAYPPQRLQKFVNIQGMQPRSFLWLQWPMPDLTKQYGSMPSEYIEHLMTHGGENSLTRILKDVLDLATGVKILLETSSAGTEVLLECQLTHQGRANTELVLDVIFAYVALLQRDGVHEGLYNSLADAWRLQWDWGGQEDPIDTARDLAERLTEVKPKDLLWAGEIVEKPDRDLLKLLLAKMTPSNMNVALLNKATKEQSELESFFSGQEVKTLKHYGINYTEQDFKDALTPGAVEKWESWLHGEVTATSIEQSITDYLEENKLNFLNKVPVPKSPNMIQGIPKSFSIRHMHAAYKPYSSKDPIDSLLFGPAPERMTCPSASPFGKDAETWFRGGWMIASPEVTLHLSLKPLQMPDEPEMTPLQELELTLYDRLLSDVLQPKFYESTVVGMTYGVDVATNHFGLDFSFGGFQPRMHSLIKGVVKEFNEFNKNAKATPELRWTRIKYQLRDDLKSYPEMPITYAVGDRDILLTKATHSRAELLEELDKEHATLNSSSAVVSTLLLSRQLRLTALAMGNIEEKDAKSLIGDFLDNIESPAGVSTEQQTGAGVERVTPIANLSRPVEVRKMNPQDGDPNDVAVVSVIAGVSTVERRVLLNLLASLFQPMAYNYLRTDLQLGYVADASVSSRSNVMLMNCVVQGHKQDADAMEAAIHHLTLDMMPKRLLDLSDTEFNAYKDAFRQEIQQPPMKAEEEFTRFSAHINRGGGGTGFDLINEMLRFLEGPLVTKAALQAEWQKLMFPDKGERSMVVVKYFAKANATAERTLEQATKTWIAHNVSQDGRKLLKREFEKAAILKKVDSVERKKLAEAGGWFPSDQHLKLQDEKSSASKEPLQVPQLLKNLAEVRKEEMDSFLLSSPEYITKLHATRHVVRGLRKSHHHPLETSR